MSAPFYSALARWILPDGKPDPLFFAALQRAFVPTAALPAYTLATVPTVFVGPLIVVTDAAAGSKVQAWTGAAYDS